MWSIRNVKKGGREILKSNIWTLITIGIFMTLIIGKYTINRNSFYNLQIVYEYLGDKKFPELNEINQEEIMNRYAGYALSQFFTGNMTTIINEYNTKNAVSKGVIFGIFNVYTKNQMQIQNFINAIRDFQYQETNISINFIIASIIGLLIRIFISNPIQIGESRVYLESIKYRKTRIKRLTYAFKKERYWNSVKTVMIKEIFQLLWNITIIGGIIKYYSYKMVTYIIAENPDIKPLDAIKMSREMMNGNKLKTFKLDLSFIGWNILQYITFGIIGIYVTPYWTATYTMLYVELRKEYIELKKYNYELLNDEKLYLKTELEKYPDVSEKKVRKINYNKKYELSSIIIFFFIFAFVGWIWEVSLYLFRDGIFVNRGTMYGPVLPIYGVGCTLIILLTRFEKVRDLLNKPFQTFVIIMILCTIIEYATSWVLERITGLKYWDYTGVFLNVNGRVCFECSLFFGLGGSLCVYFVAPILERMIQKISIKAKMTICTGLILIFGCDAIYSTINPHVGEGITINENIK
jgi:uncharacterized membrane protein